MPDHQVEKKTEGKTLQAHLKKLQSKNLQYNKHFYQSEAYKYKREGVNDEIL